MQYSFDHLVFYANYRSPDLHSHFAKHMIFAPQGMLNCSVDGHCFSCHGVVIQSSVLHTVDITIPPMLVYLIDETCTRAQILDERYLHGKSYGIIDEELCRQVVAAIDDATRLALCELDCYGALEYDSRIKDALDLIDHSETLEPHIMEQLCDVAFLSESRLSHLFHEQVGISVAGYILLSKLSKTYGYMCDGENITNAAIHAGFSSSAHFAAVNKKHFGISAKELGSLDHVFSRNLAEK